MLREGFREWSDEFLNQVLTDTIVWIILIKEEVELLMISHFCEFNISVESYKNNALQRSAISIEENINI